MKITVRQGWILRHLGEITYRRKASGMRGYFLQKDDCPLNRAGCVGGSDSLGERL